LSPGAQYQPGQHSKNLSQKKKKKERKKERKKKKDTGKTPGERRLWI
jgi:hypothetical protein